MFFINKKSTSEDKFFLSLRTIKSSFSKYLHISEKDITFDLSLICIIKQKILIVNFILVM